MIITAIKGTTTLKAEGADIHEALDAMVEAYDSHLDEPWVCDSSEAYFEAMNQVVEHGVLQALLVAGFTLSIA